ncbi:transposase domain-containing protein [Tibeticola sediminis]|nr:transposase domain-containing protein [Tibeticola sediminis]
MEQLAARPARVRDEAMRRARACLAVKRSIDAGMPARHAVQQAAAEVGVPAGTLARWWWGHGAFAGVQGAPVAAWPALLAPRWGVQAQREAEISGQAWDAILRGYLRPEKPSLHKVVRDVQAHAASRGWTLPSYASIARRVARLDSRLVVLAREGRQAFEAMYSPLQRSVAHLSALEWVNADGHRLDVFVRLPERFGGGVGRVHLVAWQDIHSRKILSWRLTPTLNAYSALLAFLDMVARYGVPDHALMDNGREFGAKLLTGGAPWRYRFKVQADEMLGALPLLGVEVHWATPFHGQAKPIERAFRDLAEEIAKDARLAGAYTGNRPDAKPENYGSKAADWALVEQVCAEAIARHNAREGRRTETAKGRSFDAVFAESYGRRVVTKLAPSQQAMLLMAAEPVKVRPDNRVVVCGNAYACEPGWGVAGQKVVVRFDPDDLKRPVAVCAIDGQLIGWAEPSVAPFDDQMAAQAVKRYRAAARRASRERLRYLEQVEMLTAPAPDAAGAVEPAAVRMFQSAGPARDAQEEARLDELVARTDALILEMAQRMAG